MKATKRYKKKRRAGKASVPMAQPLVSTRAISEHILTRAREKPKRRREPGRVNLLSHLPVFPKQVMDHIPKKKTMAMDSNITGMMGWGAGAINSGQLWDEGMWAFPFQVLAEMAQRPEYRRMAEVYGRAMTRKWIRFTTKGDTDAPNEDANNDPAKQPQGPPKPNPFVKPKPFGAEDYDAGQSAKVDDDNVAGQDPKQPKLGEEPEDGGQPTPEGEVAAQEQNDKADKIAHIEDVMKRMKIQDAFQKLAEDDCYFGRSHLFLDFGDSDPDELITPVGDGSSDLSKAKVGKGDFKGVKNVEAMWAYPLDYNSSDPLDPTFYKPQSWQATVKRVHASRFLTFFSREVPDMLKPIYSFGGLSLSQIAKPYVDNWLRTRQSVADLISSFSIFVLKTNLTTQLAANNGQGDDLFTRADLFNELRDNRGLMIVDKDKEDFSNVSATLGTLDVLQAQTQEHMAFVSGTPTVILLGIQPAGLNASSEGELQAFYDWILSSQESLFRSPLTTVINFIQLSEFGEIDPDIAFDFNPVRTLDDIGLANVQSQRATTDTAYLNANVVTPLEVRKRLATDPDSPYQNIKPDDLPAPPPPPMMPGMADEDGNPMPALPPLPDNATAQGKAVIAKAPGETAVAPKAKVTQPTKTPIAKAA